MAEQQKRQVALKLRVVDILEANYVKEEGWEPNYMKLLDGRKCSRVNMVGVVIEVPESTEVGYDHFTLDDGSGSIMVRVFENTQLLKGLTVGSVVLMIGRPRQYQESKYVVPEIVRKIEDQKWVQVRKKELELFEKEHPKVANKETTSTVTPPVVEKQAVNETVVPAGPSVTEDKKGEASKNETQKDPYHDIIEMIRDLDKGDGADIEEITSSTKILNADTIIESLLREGEIFELRPGRLKVLE